MSKQQAFREQLSQLADWDDFLRTNSGLPGPRANLELLQAVADEGDESYFRHLLTFTPDIAPTNTPEEFLAACGAVGLGRLIAEGRAGVMADLRPLAGDPRWRVREGVAMALQRIGDANMPWLLNQMQDWAAGDRLEQRAAVAGLCEPRLLAAPPAAAGTLALLDAITTTMVSAKDRQTEPFRVLRQALGYGWSVAAVAAPAEGKRLIAGWLANPDRDVRWIMRENLRKDRLRRLDAAWVDEQIARLSS